MGYRNCRADATVRGEERLQLFAVDAARAEEHGRPMQVECDDGRLHADTCRSRVDHRVDPAVKVGEDMDRRLFKPLAFTSRACCAINDLMLVLMTGMLDSDA